MEGGVVLLTRIVPGGSELGSPPTPSGTPKATQRRLWGEPLALGVSQVLAGSLQGALAGALLLALGEPLDAHLGAPLGSGALLLVSGAVLVALAQGPSVGRARAAVALGSVAAVGSFLVLGLQGLLLLHGCQACRLLGASTHGALLGTQLLLLTSSAAGAALSVSGAVAAARAGPKLKGAGQPVVIYQTALPSAGAGLAEATPP